MKFRWLLISTILFLIITVQVQAVDISYKGMLESYLEGSREDGEEYFTSLTEFNLKLDTGTFNYNIHLDGSLLFDEKRIENLDEFSPEGEFELNKLYFNYWFSEGQFKLGKQRIAWGSGYFFNPTDLVNPLKEEQKGDINPREATESIFASYYLGNGTLEAVVATDFQPLGPDTDTEATEFARQYDSLLIGEVELPEGFSEEKELALRYSTLIDMYDLSFLYYQGREDYPVIEVSPGLGKLIIKYPQKDVLGVNLSGTIGDLAVWGEATYSKPEIGNNYLQSIIGLDYTFENGVHLLGEYYRDESLSNFIPDQEVNIKDFICLEADYNLTDLIKLEGGYLSPFNSDYYQVYAKLTYSIKQNLELETGLNKIGNEKGTIFEENSIFSEKDKIYCKMTYYF